MWASGFSAAFLKKHSVATKGSLSLNELGTEVVGSHVVASDPKPAVTEAALLLILEKFFQVVLNLPSVNRYVAPIVHFFCIHINKCIMRSRNCFKHSPCNYQHPHRAVQRHVLRNIKIMLWLCSEKLQKLCTSNDVVLLLFRYLYQEA